MGKLKNAKYELFALGIYKGKSATQAAKDAGYSKKTAGSRGHQLLKIIEIQGRIAELFQKTENQAILSKQQLAEMYTRMLKTLHSDFLTMSADGVWFHDIGEETLKQEALRKVKTRIFTEKHGRGESQTITEKQFDEIELESKVSVGQALAKLMGYDAPNQHNVDVALHFDKEDADL
jgi:phage terminase small subunit